MRLIGIHGKAGSGKDTLAEYLMDQHNFHWFAFADPLKMAAAAMFGIPEFAFHDMPDKETVDPYWGIAPRKIAQFLGTEMVRDTIPKLLPNIGNQFWIRRLEIELAHLPKNAIACVSDVRFQNELDWVLANDGIIIHLTRPGADGTVGIPNHPSEADLDFKGRGRIYHVNNDSTLDSLYATVDAILDNENFI